MTANPKPQTAPDPQPAESAVANSALAVFGSASQDAVASESASTAPPEAEGTGWLVRGEQMGALLLAVTVVAVAVMKFSQTPPAAFEFEPAAAREASPLSDSYHLTVDINRDSWRRLSLIPGIGEKTAQQIVAFREQLGGFASIDDLLQIRGVGPKKLDRWRPYLRITPLPNLSAITTPSGDDAPIADD